MTNYEHLRALAEAAKGWKYDIARRIEGNEFEGLTLGSLYPEDGEFYDLITVDCENYYQSSEPLANYLMATPSTVISALLDELAAHKAANAQALEALKSMKNPDFDAVDSFEQCEAAIKTLEALK